MVENMWDFYQRFFERFQHEHGRGSEALSAFMDLRRLLEPYWTEDAARTHPIRNMVGMIGGGTENVLISFAARLRALEGVEGYSSVLKRLANSREYSSAEAEVETCLRFVLSGFEVAFVSPTPKERTPDLRVTKKGHTTSIEVTSVAGPDEDLRAINLNSEVFGLLNDRMTGGGGFLSILPSPYDLKKLKEQIEAAKKTALDDDRVVKVHLPGLGLVFVAPKSELHNIPERFIGSFYLNTQTPLPHPEKIARKIREKGKRQCMSSDESLLVVYDRLMSSETLTTMLENGAEDEIALVVDSFPRMLGAALVVPWGAFQHEPVPTKSNLDGDRLYLHNSLAFDFKESIIIWKNRHSEERLADDLVMAFADYPKLLASLLNSPISDES